MGSKSLVDRFFDEEIKKISVESRAVASRAAYELQADIQRQIRRNFVNPSLAFMRGVKVSEFENAVYVRLSPILSSYAQDSKIEGSPNLWILLPDGARLGFKRIGAGFNWDVLKRRYGTKLSFVVVNDGTVVLYRLPSGAVKPIYKLQHSVNREAMIEFFESAERIITNY